MTQLSPYVQAFAMFPPLRVWKAKAPEGLIEANIEFMGREKTIEQAGSICDLTSYIVMRIGIGADRMKRLEQASGTATLQNGAGSVSRVSDSNAFDAIMDRWVGSDKPGVVQFKFKASSDAHTFAVERDISHSGKKFQVYQAYQGGYRLSDFLGRTNVREFLIPRLSDNKYVGLLPDELRDAFQYNSPCPQGEARDVKRWYQAQADITKNLTSQCGAVANTGNSLREPMGEVDFREKVLSTLSSMAGGSVSGAAYQSLSGHHASGSVGCSKMLIAEGDFDPKDVVGNYLALSGGSDITRGWIEIDK